MSPSETPDWLERFGQALEQAGQELAKGLEEAGHIATAQAAMGWMLQGELAKAQSELAKLPPDRLAAVSLAAATLSQMADDEAARR